MISVKEDLQEDPVRFSGTPECREWLSGRTPWHVWGWQGTGRRHQMALDRGRGHQQGLNKSEEAINHLPVFPQSQGG